MGILDDIAESLGTAVDKVGDAVGDVIDAVVGDLIDRLGDLLSSIGDAIAKLFGFNNLGEIIQKCRKLLEPPVLGELDVTVLNSKNDQPIPEATVTAEHADGGKQHSGKTDDAGKVHFDDMKTGSYSVTATKVLSAPIS